MSETLEPKAWRVGQQARVPWGTGELDLRLPDNWPVFDARPTPQPAADQPTPPLAEMVAAALTAPLGMPPLRQLALQAAARKARPGQIAIIVDDDTRHTPADKVLPVVLDYLGAGSGKAIADDRIEIHFAGGTHRPMTREQMADKIGPDLVRRFACFNNPFDDPAAYRYLGRTRHNTPVHLSARVADADLRILVGSVCAHLQAGFAGGYKLLFPGLASRDTLKKLHLRGTEQFCQLTGTPAETNPMRQEIDRLGAYLDGTTFAVQLLLGEANEPLAAVAGEPVAAQRVLAQRAVGRFGVPLPGSADLLVCNSFPREHDLWQGFKCIANTLFAARPGGLIVATIKADRGTNGMKLPKWTLSRRVIRGLLAVTGRDGLVSIFARLLPQVNDEARFFMRFCLGTIQRNAVLIYSPNLAAEGIRFPGLELYDNLPAVWKRAAQMLDGKAPNVTVFGHGGVCYPMSNAE